MERMKVHGLAPGGDGQVLVTVGGVAQWLSLSGGNTGGDPTDPGGDPDPQDPGTGGLTTTPEVVATTSAYFTDGPFVVPLPALPDGITRADITVVAVVHYHAGPALAADTGPTLVAAEKWAARGWTGGAGQRSVVVLSAPMTDLGATDATITLGGGHAQVFLLLVDNASGLRGTPGKITPFDDVTELTTQTTGSWSTSSSADGQVYRADDAGLMAQASGGGAGLEQYLWANLIRDGRVDLTYQPILVAEVWTPNLNATGTRQAVVDGVTATQLDDVAIDAGFHRVRWQVGRAVDQIKLRAGTYGNVGNGYELWVRKLSKQAGTNAETTGNASSSTLDSGTPVVIGDLLVVFGGGSSGHGALAYDNLGAEARVSRTDADLRGTVWTFQVGATGVQTPTVTATSSADGLLVAAVGVAATPFGGGGGGGTGLPSGGNDGDVLTRIGSSAVWLPVDGLPGGGDAGDVLTVVDGEAVWQPPAAPPATRFLVPLTTVVAGEPMLVWTEDHKLVFVEETL